MYFCDRKHFGDSLCTFGDSGAPVINNQSELVGMLYGGSIRTSMALVTPIKTILAIKFRTLLEPAFRIRNG